MGTTGEGLEQETTLFHCKIKLAVFGTFSSSFSRGKNKYALWLFFKTDPPLRNEEFSSRAFHGCTNSYVYLEKKVAYPSYL